MIVRNADKVPGAQYAQGATKRILIGEDQGAPTFVMRLFDVVPGGSSSDHSHDFEHEVFILKGKATLKSDGPDRPVGVGDAIFIPANERHQLVNAGKDTLQFICVVPLRGEH